ncbi:sugar-binding protein [Paenibacillus woosongensis]|uniref:Substrate-binding domain-containing protein n=1 Tax=Paenibacillus woosongensis TaxID=307580 RepID=A0A7X2Z4X8_9BACL|nr:sugar-binding protein [Paenibacillus woosongensis]MUG47571.1 substrate-binding domain-containing protein [Paenibacillus woosongensis]
MDKKWLAAATVLIGLLTYLFIGFAHHSGKMSSIVRELQGHEGNGTQRYHIVLIEQERYHPYWEMVEKGAQQAAEEYGIDIEFVGAVRNNMDEQLNLLEKAIAARVDAIIVQGLNEEKFTPLIDKAVARGIPVVTIDTDAPDSNRLAYVGTDNLAAGESLGRLVVERTGGSGKIGVIIGSELAESQLQRLDGLKQVVEQYGGLEIVAVRSSNISHMEAIQQASEMLREHPEIGIMVGTSATDALGMLQAAKSLKRDDLTIIGFDNQKETLAAIRSGGIQATVAQQPYLMGGMAVKLLYDHFQGKQLLPAYYTEVKVLDRSNVQEGESL